MVVDELIEDLVNCCYTLGYALSSYAENSKYCLTASSGGWVWKNSGVLKLSYQSVHKSSASGSISYETKSIGQNLIAGYLTSFKSWGC